MLHTRVLETKPFQLIHILFRIVYTQAMMKKTVKLTIPPQYTSALKAAAKSEGVSAAMIVERAIRKSMKRRDENG